MNRYLFILGRNPELSLLEIISYLKARNIDYKLEESSKEIAIFSLPELDFKKIILDLGGTLKIAEFIDDISYDGNKNKITLSISSLDNQDIEPYKESLINKFKEESLKVIYKKPKRSYEKQLMPSKSLKVDLEILLYKNKTAKVIAVFNPGNYKQRDEKRPIFKPLEVISLRLAKILINLSQVKENELLLDPFAGIGTILQESLLMGINVIGIDKDIDACEKNLQWLNKQYTLKNKYKILKGDSRNLSKFLKDKIDVVVTEPYMGPYLKKLPLKETAEKIIEELSKLYYDILNELKKILKPEGKIVIIIPRIRYFSGKASMNFLGIIKKLGFELYSPIQEIKLPIPYFTERSKIERFIYILKNKEY